MGYIKKPTLTCDKVVQLGGEGNPTEVEGYYLGHRVTDGEYGPGKIHVFQTKEGNVGVWGKTNLNSMLTSEHAGQMVLVSFTGMSKPKKGRRPAYLFELQYDPKNTIDVTGVQASAQDGEEDESFSTYSAENEADNFESDSVVDEPAPVRAKAPARPAAAPSAARQAQVQALLNGRKVAS